MTIPPHTLFVIPIPIQIGTNSNMCPKVHVYELLLFCLVMSYFVLFVKKNKKEHATH